MAEESRSTCLPHCVTSCFGIRKRRGRVRRHCKAKENEKFHPNIVEYASENGVNKSNNGSNPPQQVNGTVCSSSKACDRTKDTSKLPDPVLIQPEKSALPLLDEHLNNIPESNGHATYKNLQEIAEASKVSGDCNTLDNVLNEAHPVDLPSTNCVNNSEQSQATYEKSEVLGQHSIKNVSDETTSPEPENVFCNSETSQTVHLHSDEIRKKVNTGSQVHCKESESEIFL